MPVSGNIVSVDDRRASNGALFVFTDCRCREFSEDLTSRHTSNTENHISHNTVIKSLKQPHSTEKTAVVEHAPIEFETDETRVETGYKQTHTPQAPQEDIREIYSHHDWHTTLKAHTHTQVMAIMSHHLHADGHLQRLVEPRGTVTCIQHITDHTHNTPAPLYCEAPC